MLRCIVMQSNECLWLIFFVFCLVQNGFSFMGQFAKNIVVYREVWFGVSNKGHICDFFSFLEVALEFPVIMILLWKFAFCLHLLCLGRHVIYELKTLTSLSSFSIFNFKFSELSKFRISLALNDLLGSKCSLLLFFFL